MKAVIDMPSQFDFYDGGGLDICFLSFAEVDKHGNVNVHKFNGRVMGTGGFIDICQNAKKVVFCGTLTAGGLKVELNDGIVHIAKEGRFVKFVDYLPEITFNAANAMKNGRQVIYITERCVFHLVDEGIELIEIAPGVDMEKDIFPYIGFKPIVSKNLRTMDERLFKDKLMSVKLKTRY